MSIVDTFFNAEDDFYNHFKGQIGFRNVPISDGRKYHWMIYESKLVCCESKFVPQTFHEDDENYYEYEIYSNDPLVDYTFYVDNYTIMLVDVHMDGDGRLLVLSNDLECEDEKLKELYGKKW